MVYLSVQQFTFFEVSSKLNDAMILHTILLSLLSNLLIGLEIAK